MRILGLLAVLMLLLGACDDGDSGSPSPTESPAPVTEATPTAEPGPEQNDDPTPEEEATPAGEEDEPEDLEAVVERVAQQVSELRGLELLEELNVSVMTQAELRAFIEEELVVDQHEIELFWMLRLLDDRGFTFEDALIEMQAQEIQGFYNAETAELFVITEDDSLSPLKRVFLAHEIVHALQDQHFDLSRLEAYLPDRDRSMALRAMIEGDATLTQEMYVQEYLTTREQFAYLREALGLLRFNQANEAEDQLPRYLTETFTFPYFAGVEFALHTVDGDFSEMNEILQDPPSTTQQVMNPEAYLAGEIADPLEIDMPDVIDRLQGDWEEVIAGTLGVLDLTIMLEENGVETVDDALSGWGGTEFVMYEYEEDLLTVLATRWGASADAAEFEDALVETMAGYTEEDGVWFDDGRFYAIVVDGDSVNLTSSTNPDALVDALGID